MKPDQVEPEYVAISEEMIEQNINITLNVDIMFVNELPFLVTHSRKVGLVTTEYLRRHSARHISQYLLQGNSIYNRGGF